MNFIWTVLGSILILVLYAAFRVLKDLKQKLPKCVVPLPSTSSPSASAAFFVLNIGREMKSTTADELQALKERSDDMVIIDCRADRRPRHPAIANAHALPIKPAQVAEVLNWLPANRSAGLCGASDLCPSRVMKRRDREDLP